MISTGESIGKLLDDACLSTLWPLGGHDLAGSCSFHLECGHPCGIQTSVRDIMDVHVLATSLTPFFYSRVFLSSSVASVSVVYLGYVYVVENDYGWVLVESGNVVRESVNESIWDMIIYMGYQHPR